MNENGFVCHEIEHGHARAQARHELVNVAHRCLRDLRRRARRQYGAVDFLQSFQAPVVLAQRFLGAFALGHLALNAEVSGDPAGGIVETNVVPFNRHRRPVELALIGFNMQSSRIEKAPPHFAAMREVVLIKIMKKKPSSDCEKNNYK